MIRIIVTFICVGFIGCQQKSESETIISENKMNSEDSNEKQNSKPCLPPTWSATGKKLRQDRLNDSTEFLYLNDTLWFTIEREKQYDSTGFIAYLKFYGRTGLLEEEGYGIYWEHPIADFSEQGEWKRYDCNGELIGIKKE